MSIIKKLLQGSNQGRTAQKFHIFGKGYMSQIIKFLKFAFVQISG